MGTQGGGSSGHGGSHREGAARTSPACERRCYGSVRQKSREGAGFSPRRQASGEDDGVREATQREIDAVAGA
jgi:hypothetical protein